MWWIRLINVATHIPELNHVAKAALSVVVKAARALIHTNLGSLGLDRLLHHLGF